MKDDRLISLNAAIDALNKKWGTCIIGESLIRDAWDTLKTLPSAQLAQDLTNGCTDTISRQAALDAIDGVDWYHQNKHGEMVHGANDDDHQAWYKAEDIYKAIESVPPAQSEYVHGRNINVDELIKILNPESNYVFYDDAHGFCINTQDVLDHLCAMPSTQSEQRNARVFQGIVVEYPSISVYPEYEGKPYFSIKYTVNGQKFIGYGTYKPEVLSEFLKEYFMPPTQPGWIPVTERLPEDAYPVIVTWKNDDPKSYYQYILGKHYTGVAHFKNGIWYWYSSTTEDVLMEYGRCDSEEFDEAIQVLAWQLLPTPYREGGRNA